MYLGCLTLLSITTSLRERPNYMAFIGISIVLLNRCVCDINVLILASSMGTRYCAWPGVRIAPMLAITQSIDMF